MTFDLTNISYAVWCRSIFEMRVAKFQSCKLYDIALGFKLTLFYNDYETIVKQYTSVRVSCLRVEGNRKRTCWSHDHPGGNYSQTFEFRVGKRYITSNVSLSEFKPWLSGSSDGRSTNIFISILVNTRQSSQYITSTHTQYTSLCWQHSTKVSQRSYLVVSVYVLSSFVTVVSNQRCNQCLW